MDQLVRLVVILFVLELVFFLLQSFWPSVSGQRIRRAGIGTDLLFWFCTPLVTRPLTALVNGLALFPVLLLLGVSLRQGYHGFGPVAELPAWFQVIGMLVIGDFTGYWVHRLFHGVLWPFHAVHHSSTELDWLSSTRVHPVNEALQRTLQAFPLVLLGFTPGLLAAYLPFLTFYAILVHANLSWDLGPLRLVLASPAFHRWHHSAESEAVNKNFAGLLPVWDLVFGTLYLPDAQRPVRFGAADTAPPEDFVGLMLYPFRKRGRATPMTAA